MMKEQIAIVCHEANAAYCCTTGDDSQKSWENADQWQRDSAITGVEFILNNPDAPDSATHDSWMREKLENGWKLGPVKDANEKEHPCLVPYSSLPVEQQKKDALFKAIVNALK